MRKFLLPLALVAALATGTAAFASTNTSATGVISAIDAGKAHTVTLGKTVYHFAKTVDLSAFKKGEHVTVTGHVYKKMEGGVTIVAAAAPAMPAPAKPAKPAPKTMTTTKTSTKTTK